jgi:hypothetical protein
MHHPYRWGRTLDWLTPLLVMLPALWALLPGGLPNTADGTVHFMRAAEMVHAWQDGVYLPRWSQHLGYGYGIPLFIYTPPLPYLLVAGLHWLGLPPEAAYKGMLIAGMAVASYGAYRMSRVLLGVWAGAVSTAAFLYAPILLRELFVQGNAAQFLAWSFPPWAVWAIIQLYRTGRGGYAIGLALAVAGTLLSHNAVALLMMGMVVGLALALLAATRSWRALLWAAGGALLGLGLSAWVWMPALLESHYVALNRIAASDFRLRFVPPSELLAWPARLDMSALNSAFPLGLGAVQVGAAALGVVGWLALVLSPTQESQAQRDRRVLWGVGLFMILFALFCGFMATRWSEPVWTLLPFVALFEFPFRWHGFTALALSWLAGAAVAGTAKLDRRVETGAGALLLLLILGAALVYLYPQKLLPGTRRISPAEVVRFEVKSSAVGSTSLGEYTPIWVENALHTSPLVEDYLAGRPVNRLSNLLPPGVSAAPLEESVQRQSYQLTVAAPTTLTLALFYFPGWQATIDGAPDALLPHPQSGLVDVALPQGEYTLTLTFGATPLRRAAAWLSAIAWLGLLSLTLLATIQMVQRRGRAPVDVAQGLQPWGAAGGSVPLGKLWPASAVVGLVLLLQIGFPQLFRLHSPPDTALPAQIRLHTDFEDKLRLLGIDPPPAVVKPGQALTLVAYWRALDELEQDYAVLLHLDDPVTGETVATVDQRHPSDIPTSDWATGLYVRNPLRLVIPADADPIQYALRTGFYDPESGELLEADSSPDGPLELARVWVEPSTPPQPPDGPHVRFGENIELVGAEIEEELGTLALTWRAAQPLAADYTIFVHLLDSNGQLLGQLDGAPYDNRYPLRTWRPGAVIEDRRDLTATGVDLSQVAQIAVGVYDPATLVRLPATDDSGSPLPDNGVILPWPVNP